MRGSALLLPFCLAGCLPAPIVIGGYAADGGSYLATGKTVTDHGITAAAMRDCSTLRGLRGRDICDARPGAGAAATEDHRAGRIAGTYLVVASVESRGEAERRARDFADFTPRIVTIGRTEGALYRVLVGPLDADQATAVRGRAADAWEPTALNLR